MMSFGYEEPATKRIAPAPVGTTAINAAFRSVPDAGGTVSWPIPGAGLGLPACWITITNLGTANTDILYFNVWRSNDGPHPNVNTAGDIGIPPGATADYWCASGIDRVKFGGPATAVASHHRSSL